MMFIEIDEVIDLLAKREDHAREWGTFGEDLLRTPYGDVRFVLVCCER